MSATTGVRVVRAADHWVVIEKSAGLLSVPGKGEAGRDCAAARVAAMFPHATGPLVIHRLDMDTSGLMIFGLDPETQRALSMQFERREVRKRYEAIVEGSPRGESGEIRLRQRLDVDHRPRQIIDDAQGKLSITKWKVVKHTPIHMAPERAAAETVGRVGQASARAVTRIEFTPITGRSHQLRLAAATPAPVGLGCPIVGDDLYGSGKSDGARLMLAATYLAFRSPKTNELVELELPAPF